MIFYRVGHIIGSPINGFLHDLVDSRKFANLNLLYLVVVYTLMIIFIHVKFSMAYGCIVWFFFGIIVASAMNLWIKVLVVQFDNKDVSYSTSLIVHCLFTGIGFQTPLKSTRN
jgi:predicted MFS family arabinose efflux permease